MIPNEFGPGWGGAHHFFGHFFVVSFDLCLMLSLPFHLLRLSKLSLLVFFCDECVSSKNAIDFWWGSKTFMIILFANRRVVFLWYFHNMKCLFSIPLRILLTLPPYRITLPFFTTIFAWTWQIPTHIHPLAIRVSVPQNNLPIQPTAYIPQSSPYKKQVHVLLL